jgi:hypothetical protein
VKTAILTFVIVLFSASCVAQESMLDSIVGSDTLNIKEKKPHSPTKATIMSAALPGLGQVYNKKYWKVPIIWGGIGTSMYFAISNHNSFKKFKSAYSLRVDGDPNTIDEFDEVLTDSGLELNMEFHQRNRDLSFIVAGLLYVFNIVDAAVDAHLFNFPKNDKLSFNLQPTFEMSANNQVSRGFKLVINL